MPCPTRARTAAAPRGPIAHRALVMAAAAVLAVLPVRPAGAQPVAAPPPAGAFSLGSPGGPAGPDAAAPASMRAAASAAAPSASAPGARALPMPYGAAVAARFPAPSVRYDTPGLQPDRTTFTSNEELRGLLRGWAAGSGGPRLVELGRSAEGEPVEALHVGAAPSGAPADRRKPRVLLIGQQHGDEPAGAEALIALARLLQGPPLAAVLERIEVVLVPRANPDGAALGRRVGAHGSDINRDHLLLRTPEARALAAAVRRFDPAVVVDVHEFTVVGRYLETFGAVQRHDVMLQYATVANLPPELARASEQWFRQPIVAALAAEGLTSDWYHTSPTTPGDRRLAMGGVQPDTARNVYGLRHAVSLLLEGRGVGIGRLHLERRVHAHVVALRAVLEAAAARADELLALRERAAAEVAAQACRGSAVVLAAPTPDSRQVLMLDPATGADLPVTVAWSNSLVLRPLVQRARPCGYWLAGEADEAVQRLRSLGVRLTPLERATELQAEAWRETSRVEEPRPDVRGRITEPQTAVLVQVETEARRLAVPAGSWYVPLDQPLANLVVAALEPDSPSSWFANRLIPRLGDAARVMTPP